MNTLQVIARRVGLEKSELILIDHPETFKKTFSYGQIDFLNGHALKRIPGRNWKYVWEVSNKSKYVEFLLVQTGLRFILADRFKHWQVGKSFKPKTYEEIGQHVAKHLNS